MTRFCNRFCKRFISENRRPNAETVADNLLLAMLLYIIYLC